RSGPGAAQGTPDLRELRLSTARRDADGGVRFKGTVRVPARGQSWAIDAMAHDLLGRVRVEGNLTARTPFVRTDPVALQGRAAPRAAGSAGATPRRPQAVVRDGGNHPARPLFARTAVVALGGREAPSSVEKKPALRAKTAGAELPDLAQRLDAENRPLLAQGP